MNKTIPDVQISDPNAAYKRRQTNLEWRRLSCAGLASGLFLMAASSGNCQTAPGASAHPAASQGTVTAVQAQQIVANATAHGASWSGPRSGPPGASGKYVALMAEDLRNGGILGVAQGAREAIKAMGWRLKIFDGGGKPEGRAKALTDALESKPDGLILCGADAQENKELLARFAAQGVPVVGWHAGAKPGPIDGTSVAMNVTTDPLEVARVAAMTAVAQSGGHAGVVIFTDSKYGIAMAKANTMAEIIKSCKQCTLLEVRDLAISESGEKMPAATKDLLTRYGKRWTHALAINDIYFDYATPVLEANRVADGNLSLLSAGDGSAASVLAHSGENLSNRNRGGTAEFARLASNR